MASAPPMQNCRARFVNQSMNNLNVKQRNRKQSWCSNPFEYKERGHKRQLSNQLIVQGMQLKLAMILQKEYNHNSHLLKSRNSFGMSDFQRKTACPIALYDRTNRKDQ